MTPQELIEIEQASTFDIKKVGNVFHSSHWYQAIMPKYSLIEFMQDAPKRALADAKFIATARQVMPLLVEFWDAETSFSDEILKDETSQARILVGRRFNSAKKALEEFKL